jgi:maltooligosyltrehalose trehalohydrolase
MSFVSFLQNHDQIGNRALGERLVTLANADALRAAVALQLLAPQIPLIFMGEEAGAEQPFLYFTDCRDPGLAEAVREGRRGEFAKFPEFSDPSRREQIPDPNAPETFERSRPVFDGTRAEEWHDLYSALISIRRQHIIPRLKDTRALGAETLSDTAVFARWRLGDGATLSIVTNLGDTPVRARFPRSIPVWGKLCDALPAASTIAWIDP